MEDRFSREADEMKAKLAKESDDMKKANLFVYNLGKYEISFFNDDREIYKYNGAIPNNSLWLNKGSCKWGKLYNEIIDIALVCYDDEDTKYSGSDTSDDESDVSDDSTASSEEKFDIHNLSLAYKNVKEFLGDELEREVTVEDVMEYITQTRTLKCEDDNLKIEFMSNWNGNCFETLNRRKYTRSSINRIFSDLINHFALEKEHGSKRNLLYRLYSTTDIKSSQKANVRDLWKNMELDEKINVIIGNEVLSTYKIENVGEFSKPINYFLNMALPSHPFILINEEGDFKIDISPFVGEIISDENLLFLDDYTTINIKCGPNHPNRSILDLDSVLSNDKHKGLNKNRFARFLDGCRSCNKRRAKMEKDLTTCMVYLGWMVLRKIVLDLIAFRICTYVSKTKSSEMIASLLDSEKMEKKKKQPPKKTKAKRRNRRNKNNKRVQNSNLNNEKIKNKKRNHKNSKMMVYKPKVDNKKENKPPSSDNSLDELIIIRDPISTTNTFQLLGNDNKPAIESKGNGVIFDKPIYIAPHVDDTSFGLLELIEEDKEECSFSLYEKGNFDSKKSIKRMIKANDDKDIDEDVMNPVCYMLDNIHKCLKCGEKHREVCFAPCGCYAFCEECSKDFKFCPFNDCNTFIKTVINVNYR